MTVHPNVPLPYLPSLVQALAAPPELDLITTVVRRFIEQRQAFYYSRGATAAGDRGLSPPSFTVSTLLQALTWERLDQSDVASFSHDRFRALRCEILESSDARALGVELHTALGWDQEVDARQADPELLKLLVWSVLMLEIEPLAMRKPFHVAGYDLCAPGNWRLSYDQLRTRIVEVLQWKTQTVQGHRSSDMARLALCILEPLMPDFAIRDVPQDLLYGTHRWANFAHGVALAEVLQPGSSSLLTYEQLTGLVLEQSGETRSGVMEIIAATRVLPAVQWALADGILAHRQGGDYSSEDAQLAVSRLDRYSARLARSTLALLSDPPKRIEMARDKLSELFSPYVDVDEMIMIPTTFTKRFEYSIRNPSPRARSGEFYLLDVFAAGYTKAGMDVFKPLGDIKPGALKAFENLKGVDMPALFEAAFKVFFDEARAAYEFFLNHLFKEIPAADSLSLNEGKTTVYALQRETGKPSLDETDQDRSDATGRFGFLIHCEHDRRQFAYEVFPFESRFKRRTDLVQRAGTFTIEVRSGLFENLTGGPPRSYARTGAPMSFDWSAYSRDANITSPIAFPVVPVVLGVFPAVASSDAPATHASSAPRLAAIAALVARQHMFYDYERVLTSHRGITGVEFVSSNFPPALRIAALLIPGLSCYNAAQTNESPVLSCVLDVGSVMALPMLRLAGGMFRMTVQAGRIGIARALPAFGGAASAFIQGTGRSYLQALDPLGFAMFLVSLPGGIIAGGRFSAIAMRSMATRMKAWANLKNSRPLFRMPQRVNGRIGYPLSGRGAGLSSSGSSGSGRIIKSVGEYDEFIARHHLFKDNPKAAADMRLEVLEGADIRVHVRADGSHTLVMRDAFENIFIDLATDKTVAMVSHYNYRELGRWRVANEASHTNLTYLKVNQVISPRASLDSARVSSVKDAIESGAYLPPIDVKKTGAGYSVINGNHRMQAALDLKLGTVPVVIHAVDPKALAATGRVTDRVVLPVGGAGATSAEVEIPSSTFLPKRPTT
ncbi:ParB/RepB/Spo0J family partition protein [Pseudomonas sp. DWP3-1-2]|uniref:ParB/RepB/Spo0J family partition protein n=1 Tax=Pseudomonas sp. DWP3-1-2 TaxID=2804645 RepID=UPI003CF65324